MTSCSVRNASAISCDHGCCGTETNRTCCEFTLSENVIIVICVVGALVVVAIVVALIICLTSKPKNRVTRIGPRERRTIGGVEPRSRFVNIPNPPPYSEAPPQYDSLQFADDSRSNPRSTDPILPRARKTRADRQQNTHTDEQRHNRSEPLDAPPSYISVIQVESLEHENNRHYSPEPGTSGLGNNRGSRLSNNYGTTPSSVFYQNRQNSPHPSLSSGRISTAMNRADERRTFHRTASERSRQLSSTVPADRRQHGRNNESFSPVTIREITVHSQVINSHTTENHTRSEKGGKTKTTHIHSKHNRQKQISNNKSMTSASVNAELLPGALEDNSDLIRIGESPTPLSQSAAARSAKRRQVIHQLQQRRQITSPTPVQ